MKKIGIIFLLLIVVLSNGCQNSSAPDEFVIYFNSFESDSDITGWSGVTKESMEKTACPNGGNSSLHISGGCIQPAASLELSNISEGNYKISFWAKMGQSSQSALIVLAISEHSSESDKLAIPVTGNNWKYYESDNRLRVAPNQKLQLDIFVGGIIYADIFLDNIVIEK